MKLQPLWEKSIKDNVYKEEHYDLPNTFSNNRLKEICKIITAHNAIYRCALHFRRRKLFTFSQ